MKKIDWDEYGGVIYFIGFIGIILILSFWGNIASVMAGRGWDPNIASSCKDVTSYDHNWNNDMLCTRADGSTFYTDYEGAHRAVEKQDQATSDSVESTSTSEDVIPVASPKPKSNTTCKDVTTYDYDWNNDMLCTRADGTTFYTNYEGARQAESV